MVVVKILKIKMSVTTNSGDITLESDEVSRNQFNFGDNESNYKENTPILRQIIQIKISKILMALGIALIILFAFAVIVTLSLNKTNRFGELKNKNNLNLLRSIIITTDKKIWTFNVDNKKCTPLQSLKSEVVALDAYLEETIFWNDKNASVINSISEKYPNVTHTKRLTFQAIAVDYVTYKLYLVSENTGSLGIIDLKTKNFGLVYHDLENPHDIVLDPAEGLMFIVQFYQSIIKANMDGTLPKTIIHSSKVSSIAIDRKATRIYWSNDQVGIQSSDYDGNYRQIVISIPMSVLSLTTIDNQLFWTRASNWNDICPCTNLIWTCTLYRRVCNNVSSHQLPFDTPKLLKTSFNQHRHLVKNPCDKSNGDCQHLCLMTSKGSHGCACHIGWTLNPDGKTCTIVSKLIVYVQGNNYVYARIIGSEMKESFDGAIVPTKLQLSWKTNHFLDPDVYFDYNMENGEFYFSDVGTNIYKINLLKDDEQTKVLSVSNNYVVRNIVYDWIKDSIFYVKQSKDPSRNHSIMMYSFKADINGQKIILTSKFKKESHIDCPRNLVIQPNHEYLFFSDYSGVNDNLRRVSTNGKGLILWKPLYSTERLNLLIIDCKRPRLHWLMNGNKTIIRSANLEGSEEETVHSPAIFNDIKFIGAEDLFFVGNYTGIWSFNLGVNFMRLAKKVKEETFIKNMKIYSFAARNVT